MNLVTPFEKIDAEDIDSFADASTFVVSLLHSPNRKVEWCSLAKYRSGSDLVDTLINLLWLAESPSGADQMLTLMHPIFYYKIQKDCRSVVDIQKHSSSEGYSGTILGHRFFSHARLRSDTMMVVSQKEDLSKILVASPRKWDPKESLFV